MTVADFTTRLAVINRTGTTHRFVGDEPKCEALAAAPRWEAVSTNQCLVYNLAGCGTCFPVADGRPAVIIYLYLWIAASAIAIIAGCIAARSNHRIATAPYRMDLDAAQHRQWQTRFPARHHFDDKTIAAGSADYQPRHASGGDITREFDRIVESFNWEVAV